MDALRAPSTIWEVCPLRGKVRERTVRAAYHVDDPDPEIIDEDTILARLLALNLERSAMTQWCQLRFCQPQNWPSMAERVHARRFRYL